VAEAGERHVVGHERAEPAVAGSGREAADAERHGAETNERQQHPREAAGHSPAGEGDEYERTEAERERAETERRVGRARDPVGHAVRVARPRNPRRLHPRV
jgi:hypothetical protein